MEKTLTGESIRYYKRIFDECKTYEETAETIVPDTMPDILEMLHVEGVVLIRSMDAESGRATLSGSVRAYAIYSPDGGGLESIDVNIPFTVSVDSAGITPETRLTGSAELCGLDSHMLNSRKLMLRANIVVKLCGFTETGLGVCVSEADAEEMKLEVLKKTEHACFFVDVSEKSFVISDEFEPGSGRSGELMCSHVSLEVGELKMVGAKLIFKGQANLHALYAPDDGGLPERLEYSTAFSQIMELDEAFEKSDSVLKLMLSAAYIETSRAAIGGTISMELHIVAQAVTTAEFDIKLICDAYSTEYDIESEYESFEVGSPVRESSGRVVAGVFIDTLTDVEKVIGFTVYLAQPIVTEGGTEIIVNGTGKVSALCACSDGRLRGITGGFEYEYRADRREGESHVITLDVGADIFASATGRGVEFKIPIDIHTRASENKVLAGVGRVEKLEKKDKSACPSAVLYFTYEGDELWSVAKSHNSTSELIMAVNELESDAIEPGCVLLIPGIK